jgi:hypothetical protein
VDDGYLSRTRYRAPTLQAGVWWTAELVSIEPSGRVYYDLKEGVGRPSDQRDARSRTALEAFGALDLGAMTKNLEEYRESLKGKDEGTWSDAPALRLIEPLQSFVATFGPLGVNWGGEFLVRNQPAERLERERDRLRAKILGQEPDSLDPSRRGRYWTVTFAGHGPGRLATGEVRQHAVSRGSVGEARRMNDDRLPHDDWATVVDAHLELRRTLDLAEAIARRQTFRIRTLIKEFIGEDAELDSEPAGPWHTDYGRALLGPKPARAYRPFRLPAGRIDWPLLGQMFVGDLVTRQVDFAIPLVQVGTDGGYAVRWRATSALEVIYLELLDHLRRRSDFGIGTCGSCGGPILRTRRPGATGNQWHRGCRGGRVARWRAGEPAAALTPRSRSRR